MCYIKYVEIKFIEERVDFSIKKKELYNKIISSFKFSNLIPTKTLVGKKYQISCIDSAEKDFMTELNCWEF